MITKVIPPRAQTTPMIVFFRVRELSEVALPDEAALGGPEPGIPVVSVTVLISNDGSTRTARAWYGEDAL